MDAGLLIVAEVIRSEIGAYTPNSACRCSMHNKAISGRSNSKHLIGRAIDVPTNNPKKLFDFLDNLYPNTYGIGLYSKQGFIHIDTRNQKARWGNT